MLECVEVIRSIVKILENANMKLYIETPSTCLFGACRTMEYADALGKHGVSPLHGTGVRAMTAIVLVTQTTVI